MTDGCLWALAPQSCPSPESAAYPTAVFGEHCEPRLSAMNGRSTCALELLTIAIPSESSHWLNYGFQAVV
jgi:hypothetical protein